MVKKKREDNSEKIKGVVGILAGLVVLFTYFIDTVVSTTIAVVFLMILGFYDLFKKGNKSR